MWNLVSPVNSHWLIPCGNSKVLSTATYLYQPTLISRKIWVKEKSCNFHILLWHYCLSHPLNLWRFFVPEMFPWFAKMSGTNTCGTLFIVKDLNSPFSGNEAKSWKILVGTWSSSESKWSPLSVNGSLKRSRFPVWQLSNRKIILMAASFASDLLSEWRPYKLQHSVEIWTFFYFLREINF